MNLRKLKKQVDEKLAELKKAKQTAEDKLAELKKKTNRILVTR